MSPSSKTSILLASLLFFLSACSSQPSEISIAQRQFKSSSVLHDQWMEAFFQEKKIGYVHSVESRGTLDSADVRQVSSFARIEMDVEGDRTHTELEQRAYIDGSGHLLAFDYRQNIMKHEMSVRGERRKGSFLVEINAGERRSREFKWSPNLYTSSLLKQAVLDRGLKVGESAVFNVLLEPLLAVEDVSVKLTSVESGVFRGKKTKFYRFEERFKGIVGHMVITEEGDTIEEISPGGFSLLRADKESALAPYEALSMTSFLLSTKVKSSRKIDSPRESLSVKLWLKNVPPEYPLIDDGRQAILESSNENGAISYLLNVVSDVIPAESVSLPVKEKGFDLYLGADHVINSDNKEIIALSRKITGSTGSSLEAAKKIYSWVDKNIGKRLVDTVSALDTLKSGEGECQAHANLYAALARAAGLPAKVITGLVYSKEFDGFMYHAWNEVWVGRWIAVDTILGGFPADATHIKLTEGSSGAQLGIISLIGRLDIDILDIKAGAGNE